jgi:hypothetical protein
MRLQEFMPRQTITDKASLIGFRDIWCLVIDRIVASEDGVVHHTHMTRTIREHIMLDRNFEFTSLISTE